MTNGAQRPGGNLRRYVSYPRGYAGGIQRGAQWPWLSESDKPNDNFKSTILYENIKTKFELAWPIKNELLVYELNAHYYNIYTHYLHTKSFSQLIANIIKHLFINSLN